MHRNVTVIHTPIHSIKASWRIEIFCKSVKGYIPGWYFQNNVETSAAAVQKLVSHRKTMQNIWIADGGHRTGKTGWNCGDIKENNALQEKKMQCKEKNAMPVKLFLQTLASVNIPGPCALRPDTSLYDMLEDLNILLLAGPSIWQFDIGLAFYMNGDSLDCVVTWLKNTSDHSAQKCC